MLEKVTDKQYIFNCLRNINTSLLNISIFQKYHPPKKEIKDELKEIEKHTIKAIDVLKKTEDYLKDGYLSTRV